MPGSSAIKKTKISVYLLKDGVTEDDFLTERLRKIKLKGSGTVYISQIPIGAPSWVESFFDNRIDGLVKGGAGAVLLMSRKINGQQRWFLISFGYGFHKINTAACEERFGLKIVLNAGNLKSGVRSVDRKNLSSSPKLSREQMAKSEDITSFGIDYEQDIIQSLTLESADDALGKVLTGGVSLSTTTAFNISDVNNLLPKLYGYYTSTKYKDEKYDWIDHVSEAPKGYETRLNAKLLEILNTYDEDDQKCHLCPPELQDWTDVVGFCPSPKKDSLVKDDIHLDDYRKNRQGNVVPFDDIGQVRSRRVHLWSAASDHATKSWSLLRCIYTEVSLDSRTFVLSDGKWYVVDHDYSQMIDQWFAGLPVRDSEFAEYKKIAYIDSKGNQKTKHSEKDFNVKAAADSGYVCLDRDLIDVGPRKDIEACDLYKDGEFLHVKIFTGSSAPISHLLSQATVSADLFFGEREFREDMNEKLPDEQKLTDEELAQPNHGGYKITLGIITNKPVLELPFFSKVNLRAAKRRLETMGLVVGLVRIGGTF